ncbi:hypothetical protein LCGC14_1963530 [marine sediment metagenome]|uniref:Uncharacterized protein n=1 Tax=marine sediment metagenome TaxID=412755 RepID=A0A0F9FDS6_9ZZZZ
MDVESWAKAFTALVPFITGGVLLKWSKEWAYTEKEMGAKVSQAKENIAERLAEANADLLEALNAGKPLRGELPNVPDYAGRHSRDLRQKMTILFRFEITAMMSEAGHDLLLVTFFASLAVLGGGILAAANQAALWCERVFISAIVLVVLQGIVLVSLRKLKKQVDQITDII